MLDKRIIIELIKYIEKIQFTEQIEGDVIGYINDDDRIVQVSLLADNLGQYLELSYPIKTDNENIEFYKERLLYELKKNMSKNSCFFAPFFCIINV